MDAVYYAEGRIRPVVAAVKSLASAIAIGSGAAVGREGPIIQIGASFGSTIGQIIPLAAWQRITLVAAGAGAGIAATFNTPIGGVMFAIELIMPEVSVRTFLPVALATGTATFIGRLYFGLEPAFQVPALATLSHHPTSFGAFAKTILPWLNLSIPDFAIVGLAAMVGGGTGAAMTAVTMIFEMTRDYDIVMPMIIAVAVSIGIRRVLSHENIYTIKLVSRRHFIPKALHANMFLVHQARDVMDRDILLLPTNMSFDAFLRQSKNEGKIRHIVVARDDRIVGVLRVNTGIHRGLESANTGVTLGDVASRDFTVAHEEDIMFSVIGRMWQRDAMMAVVVRGKVAFASGVAYTTRSNEDS